MRNEVTRRAVAGMMFLFTTALMGTGAFAQSGPDANPDQQQASQETQAPKPKLPPPTFQRNRPVTYDNQWEAFGYMHFMNFQAGQDLPKRMNLGGLGAQGTWWFTDKLGGAADFHIDYGTTPVFPNPFNINNPVVRLMTGTMGPEYRGPKNQHYAIQYHALVGVSAGKFNGGTLGGSTAPSHDQTANALRVGLYGNRVKPIGQFGASIDFNGSYRWAIRVQPDLIIEHYGAEYREFVGVSGGLLWRFGHRSN